MSVRLQRLFVAGLFCAASLFVVLPLMAYFKSPAYLWQMSVPAFVQGGLEALVLFAATAAAAVLRPRKAVHIVLLCAGTFIYLRLHAVELPFILAVLWLEGILATGAVISRRRGRVSAGMLFSFRFTLGICGWTFGALLLSLLHLASAPVLLGYSGVLFSAALLTLRKQPFTVTALRYLTHRDRLVATSSAFILLSVLVLFARGPNIVDFDSIWYGLRSQWVLAPHGSIFDPLNLIALVYYYPKLFELLTLPASALTDFGFIYAINVCVYLALGICALALMRQAGMKLRYAVLVAALVVSMPAMTTMTLTAKPDLLASYFMLVGCLFYVVAIKRNQPWWHFGVFSSVLLALSTKLSAIPFGGLLSISAMIALGYQLRVKEVRHTLISTPMSQLVISILVVSGVVFLGFCWRTYLLTGYPIIGDPSITRVFDALGFARRYPANVNISYTLGSVTDHFAVFYDYLFQPTVLAKVSFVWPGNAGALLFVSGCLCASVMRLSSSWVKAVLGLSPIVVAGCLLAVSYGNVAGGDGNYFILPVTLAGLLGLGLLWQAGERIRSTAMLILPAFIAANAYVGFLISPGGPHPGTDPFSLDVRRAPLHTELNRETELKAKGLWPIEQFILGNMPADCRAAAAGDWQGIYMLPCTTENFAVHWQANAAINTEAAFVKYLNFARINLLISPKFPADTPFFKTADRLRKSGLPVIETASYFAVDLRSTVGAIVSPGTDVALPGEHLVYLTDILSTANAVDLASSTNPRQNLYVVAPPSYEFFSESTTLLLSPNAAIRFPAKGLKLPASWVFSASVGFTPEDSQQGVVPMNFEVRVVGVDGRELAAQSWKISAGEYRSISFDFHATRDEGPVYLELRYNGDATTNRPSMLLLGQPEIRSE